MAKYEEKISDPMEDGCVFVLNSRWNSVEAIEKNVPNHVLRSMAKKNVKFYNIDATKISQRLGLGKRINNIMQACFYHLSGVLESDKAIGLLKNDIVNLYGAKGEHIVKMNNDAVDSAISNLKEIHYDKLKWLGL